MDAFSIKARLMRNSFEVDRPQKADTSQEGKAAQNEPSSPQHPTQNVLLGDFVEGLRQDLNSALETKGFVGYYT